MVSAFFNYRLKWGVISKTDDKGVASLDVPYSVGIFEIIYVYPEHSYWNVRKIGVPIRDYTIKLSALPYVNKYQLWRDILNIGQMHKHGNRGRGLKVAVIDTGIGPHADIKVADGKNFTKGSGANDYRNVDGHGTHVAGIIGAHGQMIGIAPECDIYGARIQPYKNGNITNYSIGAAIEDAINSWECDIINLSIGGPYDSFLYDRVGYATDNGTLLNS